MAKIRFQWTIRVFCRFLLHLGYAISGSRMSCFLFSQPRARGGPPSNRIVWKRMEKMPLKTRNDQTSSQRKTHIIKMFCAPTARRLEPSKFIRICTCPAEPKSRLKQKVCSLPTAAHFHSDKIPSIRTSPLSLFVFIFGREDNPRQSRIRSLR